MLCGYWYLCLRYICSRFIGICLHSLDEKDIPSKFDVSTPDFNECEYCFVQRTFMNLF